MMETAQLPLLSVTLALLVSVAAGRYTSRHILWLVAAAAGSVLIKETALPALLILILAFFPVLGGLAKGDEIVTSGSFLVDAETRLNPAAGSIYFGGSSGAKGGAAGTTIRSTTPEDPDAKIVAALAKLSPADRELAEKQRTCPILKDSRLGSMGVPIKLTLAGETVFLCCAGCKGQATADPAGTAERVKELRARNAAERNATEGVPYSAEGRR